MSVQPGSSPSSNPLARAVRGVGAVTDARIRWTADELRTLGGMTYLFVDATIWSLRPLFSRTARFRVAALFEQMTRVGVDSIGIVVMVQMFIGCILALQLAPTLQQYGQIDQIATVVAIAMVRELGPMLTAVVLSGFAGASIAAEIGAMVESEEIKALRAHALDPIHFLVVPRFMATVMMTVGLTLIANAVGIFGGFLTSWGALGIPPQIYMDMTQGALTLSDLVTGLVKAGVFGVLVSMIACYEGLNVSGGAAGVGRATTVTVVKSIVGVIGTDALFTASFYALGL